MRPLDWLVLIASLVLIAGFGMWRSRGNRNIEGYLLASRSMPWWTITLSIMATQASAITFLSTPGQAYADGMRFVQFYFGLPIAMVVLCVTAVPIYHRLKVYTAYEYLEQRFDAKTRALAAGLFLTQRGLAAGLTIYAPAIILSLMLGWSLFWTNLLIGGVVVVYTAAGGSRAVNATQLQQMLVILLGMAAAFVVVLALLPPDLGIVEAAHVVGRLGRLKAVDFSFDWNNRYNFWSGLIGGTFLALSYFGTDQSQVGRYLGGRSVSESRLGLLANGLVKVPMQFLILLLGANVFLFYLFSPPPLLFNTVEAEKARSGPHAARWAVLETQHEQRFEERKREALRLVEARRAGDAGAERAAGDALARAHGALTEVRRDAAHVLLETDPRANPNDTNYVFLRFVLDRLPVGLVGLVIAAIFAASMSSTSAELNALASTTVVDFWKRFLHPGGSERQDLLVSRLATVMWGGFAIAFAESANRLGTLVEAVNILGSLFYGTILGIFLSAFYLKRVSGTPVFLAALVAEAVVVWCFVATRMSFLWYNVVGCLVVLAVASLMALAPRWRAA